MSHGQNVPRDKTSQGTKRPTVISLKHLRIGFQFLIGILYICTKEYVRDSNKATTPMSSLVELTFALESQNRNDAALYRQNGKLYNVHEHPTGFLNTADRSAAVVFITASSFL